MELVCYLEPGWAPLLRPAPASRPWMDDAPDAFAYRCLPLNIANAHGWELLNPHGFEAEWDGGDGAGSVIVRPDPGAPAGRTAVSLFGLGVVTFHVEGIIRTPPGWNLWVGGSPNRPKDAIAPLNGVIETDWSPFSFTMNWKFTRPNTPVRFEALEPICFLFPVQRGALESIEPRLAPIADQPDLRERFHAWSRSRDAFQDKVRQDPPRAPADHWQKHYYRGVDIAGRTHVDDHQAKLRLENFDRTAFPDLPPVPADDAALPRPAPAGPHGGEPARLALARREWLLETLERQRDLAPSAVGIERRAGLSADEFLERYYAANRPVILTGEMEGWPALKLWTPDYLKARVGSAMVEYQHGRAADPRFERDKDAHRARGPFDAFIDAISAPDAGNDTYMTAYNAVANTEALSPLAVDLGRLDKVLAPDASGMMWIGPAGTLTALHHDLTNNLIAQVTGRKRLLVLPAAEVGRLYNDQHVFSRLTDLEDPALDFAAFPRLTGARAYPVTLEAGEILFMPLAWWHQVRSLSFSVSLTYTAFRWPNDAAASYPPG
ncbi:MAG: cupin-like domain-containing protein [Proteobacteria bacterium]|nr:cupin-like domain-containing protein [Pseudomonadota bacterium]